MVELFNENISLHVHDSMLPFLISSGSYKTHCILVYSMEVFIFLRFSASFLSKPMLQDRRYRVYYFPAFHTIAPGSIAGLVSFPLSFWFFKGKKNFKEFESQSHPYWVDDDLLQPVAEGYVRC